MAGQCTERAMHSSPGGYVPLRCNRSVVPRCALVLAAGELHRQHLRRNEPAELRYGTGPIRAVEPGAPRQPAIERSTCWGQHWLGAGERTRTAATTDAGRHVD